MAKSVPEAVDIATSAKKVLVRPSVSFFLARSFIHLCAPLIFRCVMYITKIRGEEEASRKQSDDLLTRADAVIDKGDQLNKLKSIVLKAERDFSFDVNYTSGTVLERNSLLNIAVINRRKNIVKWLIEEKHSDIETCDRGNFTPLLNAGMSED